MRDLLAENGSIYVHLDWHVGHYVKVLMDEIFGYENFVNEVVWHYSRWTAEAKKFQKMHDIILWYSKTANYTYNLLYQPYKSPQWIEDTVRKVINGKLVRVKTPAGEYIKREKENVGVPMHDVWEDINFIAPTAKERIDFDTQKPEALLKRIILASSNPGDIVADFFCGSGTTFAVAEKLGRRWIGCDLSKFAIQVTRKRLLDIHNSKDLMDEKKEKYGKPARPFELWNIGNYETVYWREKQDEYLTFMLKLYQAQPLTGFRYLHGRKGDRAVHVGPLNAPVTMEDIEKVVVECRANNFNKADVLGWETGLI